MGFSSLEGFNGRLIAWRYDLLARYFHGTTCLELGCSDGQGTRKLLEHFDHVTAVDADPGSVKALPDSAGLTPICSRFEDLRLGERFPTVVAAHIMEHVDDPQAMLATAKEHLAPGGRLLVDVPNAMSLHRQLGVLMGLLDHETDLNDADHSIGHQRVYTPTSFKDEILRAGLNIQTFGGVFLKLLSNAQLESFDEAQLHGMLVLGERYPELAGEIYVVATV